MIPRYASLILASAISTGLLAQPTLTVATSVPIGGQTFATNTANDFVGVGTPGANLSMGYWNLLAPSTGIQNISYLAPSVTPTSAQIPTATLLSTDGGTDTLFWQVTAAGLEMVGSRTALEGVLDFNDPSLELKLPCTFGTTWSDVIGDTYTVSGFPVTRVGTVTGTADAWGSLSMPLGGQLTDVLRVHVRRDVQDNSAIVNTSRISNMYYFFTTNLEFPSIKLIEDSTRIGTGAWAVTKRQHSIGNPAVVGIDEADASAVSFVAYPNPTSGLLNVNIGEALVSTRVEVLDPAGRLVKTTTILGGSGQMELGSLPAGLYSMRVFSGAQLLGVRRITVL